MACCTTPSPAPKEIYPQQAFDQLFDDGSQRKRDKSVLDLVNDDAMATEKTAEGIRKFAADIVKLEKFVASKIK